MNHEHGTCTGKYLEIFHSNQYDFDPPMDWIQFCWIPETSRKFKLQALTFSSRLHKMYWTAPSLQLTPESWWLEDEFPFGMV